MKNILFIGLGSIGQRHLKNILRLKKSFKYFAIRKTKLAPELDFKNNVQSNKFECQKFSIKEISVKASLLLKIDIVFVCNPSSMHIASALPYAKRGSNLFIEKPLSNNLKQIKHLGKIIEQKKIKCAVGYQLRYDPTLSKIKKIITGREMGLIKKVSIKNAHYLPNHHKYEDYRVGYAARESLGGGVLLCFIHEIDYANFLFGKATKINCEGGKKSNLDIDVEDFAKIKIDYKLKDNSFVATLDLDFIKKKESRFCKIFFEKGFLKWDLSSNTLFISPTKGKKQLINSKLRDRNSLFFKQIKDVIKKIENKKEPKSNYVNGVYSLKVALAAKESMKVKKSIFLNSFL